MVLQKSLEQSSSKRYMTLRQLLREVSSAAEKAGATQPMGHAGKALDSPASMVMADGKPKADKDQVLKKTLVGGFAAVDGATKTAGAVVGAGALAGGGAVAGVIASSSPAAGGGGATGGGEAKPSVGVASHLKETVMGHSGVKAGQSAKVTDEMSDVSAQAPLVEPSAMAVLGRLPATPPTSKLNTAPDALAATVTSGDSASITAPTSKKAVSAAAAVEPIVAAADVLGKISLDAGGMGVSAAMSAKPGGPSGKGKRKASEVKKRRSKKDKFRETMWFKKGQLDAEAAKQAATGKPKQGTLPQSDKVDEMPMEDRYGDDGSLSHEDKDKFSLRTGHSEMMPAVSAQPVSGGVSEDYLVREMRGGRGKYIAAIIGALVLLVVVVVLASSGGSAKDDADKAKNIDAAPVVNKKKKPKPVKKKVPAIPKEATATATGFAKACSAGKFAQAWAFIGPDLQKKAYDDVARKRRASRTWRRRIGYKGHSSKLDGKAYFSTLAKHHSKWSPCTGADKFDTKGIKLDKEGLVMTSAAKAGPKSMTFMKVGDKWVLTAIAWNK